MAYEQMDNSGSIFINHGTDQHPITDKSPQLKGKAMVGGTLYYVSGWSKKRENGEKWLSLAFTKVENKQEQQEKENNDDGLPF